jgi:hypothetical protein
MRIAATLNREIGRAIVEEGICNGFKEIFVRSAKCGGRQVAVQTCGQLALHVRKAGGVRFRCRLLRGLGERPVLKKVQHHEKMAEVPALPQIAATCSVSSRPRRHAPSSTSSTSGLPLSSLPCSSPALHSHISGWAVWTMRCSAFRIPAMRLCHEGDKMAYAESYASYPKR